MTIGGCGDNVPGATCGTGTTEVDGECVATTMCGTGTVDDGAGNCVPDGSVVCTDGTVFDMATGTCIPSDDVCGDGTVLVDGVCQDPSVVTPDATEAPEPNEDATGGAGEITVPGIGQPGFVINGCITPRDNNTTEDIDIWFLEVNAPTALEIAADGVGGLAAGFFAVNVSDEDLADYIRIGVNTLTDSAKRQLYLPTAGVYALVMSDQRSLFGLGPAGNEDTCYYTTIKQIALPTPVALTMPVQTGTDNGNLQVFRYTSTANGTVLRAELTEDSDVMDPAFVALRASSFVGLATDQDGYSAGRARFIGNIGNTQTVDIVVDMEFNSAIAPQPFEIESYAIGASALPIDGSTVTVTKQNDVNPVDPIVDGSTAILRNANYYYFDVGTDADVVHFNLTGTEEALFFIARGDLVDNSIGYFDFVMLKQQAGSTLDFADEFVRFLNPGRYYVGVFQVGGTAAETYSLTSTLTSQNAAAINVGTTIADGPISEVTGSAFREFAPANTANWVEMTGGGTNLGDDLEVLYYPSSFEGWLDGPTSGGGIQSDIYFDQLFAENGSTGAQGRILLNFPLKPFLVRYRSLGGSAANQSFDFSIAARTFTDLGAISEATPATANNVALPANGVLRFLARVGNQRATVSATSTNDIEIRQLDYDEFVLDSADNLGAGDEAVLAALVYLGYVAFEVENLEATATTLSVEVTTLDAAAFVEICPSAGGNGTLVLSGDDTLSATQQLPVTFSLFGTAVTQYKVSTNGFLTFNTLATASSPTPASGMPAVGTPNGVIAGYWSDLETEVCVRNDNDRTILEWSGFSWVTFESVHAQVSIYGTNNRIEWVFGPEHTDTGQFALGGVEDLTGLQGIEVFNRTPVVSPGYNDTLLLP